MCSFEDAECFTEFFCIHFVVSLCSECVSELNFGHAIYDITFAVIIYAEIKLTIGIYNAGKMYHVYSLMK